MLCRGKVIIPVGETQRGVFHVIKGTVAIWSQFDDLLAEIEEGSVFAKVQDTNPPCTLFPWASLLTWSVHGVLLDEDQVHNRVGDQVAMFCAQNHFDDYRVLLACHRACKHRAMITVWMYALLACPCACKHGLQVALAVPTPDSILKLELLTVARCESPAQSTMLSANSRGSNKKVVAVTDCTLLRLTDADVQSLNQKFPLAASRFWRRSKSPVGAISNRFAPGG